MMRMCGRVRVGMLCGVGLLGLSAFAYDEVVIDPYEKGRQINRVFFDFKSPSAPWKFRHQQFGRVLLKEYGFTGIRTSIYGNKSKPAHPAPGIVVKKFYAPENKGLHAAKQIDPEVIIFASKKLENVHTFPAWTKDEQGVIPEKYAVLLMDYLAFMKADGLEVDVLGIDNERRFNEGNIMPEKYRAIVEALRRLTKARGVKMPKIIGHEDFAMGRSNWMETFQRKGGDTMDIFGGHYYPNARRLDRLKSDLQLAGSREKWHTELHWDANPDKDPMRLATQALLALWDCTDNGMNGLMWWDFNPKKKKRSHLMHAATVPLVNAWPVQVEDPDGNDTDNEKELHTRAFLQGHQLTIYAVNMHPSKAWDHLRFKLKKGAFSESVTCQTWTDRSAAEGSSSTIKPFGGKMFHVDLQPRSIRVFTCTLKR